jgi:hypothetical protein
MCRKFRISFLTPKETPPKNTELLAGFAFNPASSSNSSRTSLMTLIESQEAVENIRRSSAKHK